MIKEQNIKRAKTYYDRMLRRKGSLPARSGREYEVSKMKLSEEDPALFYTLWYSLIYGVNKKHKIVPPFKRPVYGEHVNEKPFLRIRDELWVHPKWIGEFLDGDGADLTKEGKNILRSWQECFLHERFVMVRHQHGADKWRS